MCRWLVYMAARDEHKVLLADLMFRSENGLTRQSFNAGSNLPGFCATNNARINADGFGLGWYHSHGTSPSLFKSNMPLWGDCNAREISLSIKTRCAFGHVRAAAPGASISQDNCHPFKFGSLMFQHNGHIEQFSRIRQRLVQQLTPEAFSNVRGVTDTEYAFALLISNLANPSAEWFKPAELEEAMTAMIQQICELLAAEGITSGFTTLNCALTDGNTCVVTRFCDKAPEIPAPSLYFSLETADTFAELLQTVQPEAGPGNGPDHAAPGDGSRAASRPPSNSLSGSAAVGPRPEAATSLEEIGKRQKALRVHSERQHSESGDLSNSCFVVASEPLVYCGEWHPCPANSMLIYERGTELRTVPISVAPERVAS